jgi:hypothetical protein
VFVLISIFVTKSVDVFWILAYPLFLPSSFLVETMYLTVVNRMLFHRDNQIVSKMVFDKMALGSLSLVLCLLLRSL